MLKTVAAAAFFAVPVVALSACSPNEPIATTPGTTPSIWTGSPAPSAAPDEGHGAQPQGQAAQPQGQAAAGGEQGGASGEKLTAQLKLADGTTVATADIEFTGGFHVDGYVKGNVRAVKDDRATLSISERGCIEGSVVVPHVVLNGTVKGDVRATQRVELGPKARVIGNVQYKLIEMSIGAEVNGKLIHESEHAAAKSVSRPQVDTTRPVNAGES